MSTTPDIQIPAPSRMILLGALLVSLVAGLSALPGIYLSFARFGAFAPAIFGFEMIVLFAAVFGILLGRGKFSDGFAIGLACIAGSILVCSVFGIYVDGRPKIGDDPTLQPWIKRMLYIRIAIVLTLAALASLAVFAREPRCWGAAVKSVLTFVPAALIVGAVMKFGLPFAGNSSEPNAGTVISFLLVAIIVGGLVSAGGHFLIRAFELGRMESDAGDAQKPVKAAS